MHQVIGSMSKKLGESYTELIQCFLEPEQLRRGEDTLSKCPTLSPLLTLFTSESKHRWYSPVLSLCLVYRYCCGWSSESSSTPHYCCTDVTKQYQQPLVLALQPGSPDWLLLPGLYGESCL